MIWPFAKGGNGYPIVVIDGHNRVASRVMCELVYGDALKPDLEAAHSCGNGNLGCMNPKHLRWATKKQNSADKVGHGTCNRGEKNGHAKITESAAREIIALRGTMLQRDIAARFGICFQQVSLIQLHKKWSWLEERGC